MSTHYVADVGHRPIPLAADNPYRGPSQRPPKPKGLDWAALTPKCRACGEKSTKTRWIGTQLLAHVQAAA